MNAMSHQPRFGDMGQNDDGHFEFPKAILLGGDNDLFAIEIEDDKFALMVYCTMEIAQLALDLMRGHGPLDDNAMVMELDPEDLSNIVKKMGQNLSEVLVVNQVSKAGQSFWRVPALDFLDEALKRSRFEKN